MISSKLSDCLNNDTGSYILPFLWYTGESRELVGKEIQAIYDGGSREFVFENRGGDWFATDFWWDIFGYVLEKAESMGMRVWCLDDSHVNTGSANDSLSKEENACYRSKNVRIDAMDMPGPFSAGAVSLPTHTEKEEILYVTAYRINEKTGAVYGQSIDMSDRIRDGLLMVDLPEGIWRIYFIMTTDNAKQGVFENYITMVSKESCRHLINEIHEKMYAHFSKYFGNTFAGFFSDEPAFGNCSGEYGAYNYNLHLGQFERFFPWWNDFPEKLAAKLDCSGSEVMALLPALWDDMEEKGNAVRLAYMDLVSELWQEYFSGQLGKWCEDHGVEYIGHNLEDAGCHMRTGWGCGHYFRSMSGQHMSGMDIVFEQVTPGISTFSHSMNSNSRKRDSEFYHFVLPKLAASLAHCEKKMENRALSEIFGATGWTCGLSHMRALFNTALICGVNHYIPHAYSMAIPQVFGKHKEREAVAGSYTPPDYVMTYLPPTFYTGGFNPQYEIFGRIIRYVQRVCHLTSGKTRHLPDVAVYYNAECDWMNAGDYRTIENVSAKLMLNGYDFEFLSMDYLVNEAFVKDGRLCMNDETYNALILPMSEIIPEKLLKRISDFAADGLLVIFTDALPQKTEKGTISPEKLENIKAVGFDRFTEELETIVPRSFPISGRGDIRFYRFEDNDGRECVFLMNANAYEADVKLDKVDEFVIFDPWHNELYQPENDGNITLSAQQLIVLYPGECDKNLPVFRRSSQKVRPLALKYDIFTRKAGETGEFKLLRKDSEAVNLNIEENMTRYCGEFKYISKFECTDIDAVLLDISEAGDAAQVILNGKDCGSELGPVCRFDIRGALINGENIIEIRTFDNPAYADREGDKSIGFGSGFPLQKHGFTGEIKLLY